MTAPEILDKWEDAVSRVIVHVPHYLTYTGEETAGGRQRKVRDVTELIGQRWGRKVIIVQKAAKPFEVADKFGTPVVGIKGRLDVLGDPAFGLATKRMIRPGDGVLTLGQEDAWPFFIKGAKAMHTGVWWDGPHPTLYRMVNRNRTIKYVEASRSVWCVDTNIINWVRCQGKKGFELAKKMYYEPNCVDLNSIGEIKERAAPHDPVRIIFARRYEYKRGGTFLLDALKVLKERGFAFQAIFSLAVGQKGSESVVDHITERGLAPFIELKQNTMDSVFNEYAHADVAVVPTLWSEGTSYSCIEAIAAGVPPVVTPVGGLANLVVPHFNGLIAEPTPEAFANAIQNIAAPDNWRKFRANCLSMRETFAKTSWDSRFLNWIRG